MARERDIEKQFVKRIRDTGGIAIKFFSSSFTGMPDRLVLLPGGRVMFAEMKRPGERPTPLQTARHEMLRGMGFMVRVVDSREKIDEVIDEIHST